MCKDLNLCLPVKHLEVDESLAPSSSSFLVNSLPSSFAGAANSDWSNATMRVNYPADSDNSKSADFVRFELKPRVSHKRKSERYRRNANSNYFAKRVNHKGKHISKLRLQTKNNLFRPYVVSRSSINDGRNINSNANADVNNSFNTHDARLSSPSISSTATGISGQQSSRLITSAQLSNRLLPPERASRFEANIAKMSASSVMSADSTDERVILPRIMNISGSGKLKMLRPLQAWKLEAQRRAVPQQNELNLEIRRHIDKLALLDSDHESAGSNSARGVSTQLACTSIPGSMSAVSRPDGSMDWVKDTDSYCIGELENKKTRPKPPIISVSFIYFKC